MDDYVLLFHKQSASIFLSASLIISLFATIKFFWSITPLRFGQFCLSICLLLLYFYHATIVSIMPPYVFILHHFRISIKPCHFMYFYNSILLVLFVYMSTTFHSANQKKKLLLFQLIYGLETKYIFTILGTQNITFCFKIV